MIKTAEVLQSVPHQQSNHTKRHNQRRLNQLSHTAVNHTEYRVITPNSYLQLVLIFPPLTASSHDSYTSATAFAVKLALLLLLPLPKLTILFRFKSPRSSRTQSNASSSRSADSGMGDAERRRPRPPATKEGRRYEFARRVGRTGWSWRSTASLSSDETTLALEGSSNGVVSVCSGGIAD